MRLKSIEISGFRGFAAKQTFDLSADATVIVGVNGLGKTSLLDAILWALCGQVERVGQDDKIVSLYSETGQARVSVVLEGRSGNKNTITRSSDGKSQTLQFMSDNREFKGTSASAKMFEQLWPDASSASDGNSAFTSALIRSVYLQQDRIRDFVEAASDQDRFNIISELVGTGRLTELQVQLEKERNSWTRAINQRSKEMRPAADRVAELEGQLSKLQKSVESPEDGDLPNWSDWWKVTEEMGSPIPSDIPSAASIDASNLLDSAIQSLNSMTAMNERRRNALKKLKTLLENKPQVTTALIDELRTSLRTAESNLKSSQERLDKARIQASENRQLQLQARELKAQHRALAQIALSLLGENCPVCNQSYDYEETKGRLKSIVDGVNDVENEQQEGTLVFDLVKLEAEASQAVDQIRRKLDEAVKRNRIYETWSEEVGLLVSELGRSTTGSLPEIDEVDALLTDCLKQHDRLIAHRRVGEQLSLGLARESAKSRITTIEQQLSAAKRELEEQTQIIKSREITGQKASEMLELLRDAASRVAVDRLRQIEPFFQRVYARIDPHPSFRIVKLVARYSRGRGRLDAEIHDRSEGVESDSPSAVLSSSQLNALAVSLFLSLNLTLPRLPIEAALLDDPIQSLDDINLLGLVDLLRRAKDRRQLIVSTHDARFGKLLSRKLRPRNSDQRTSVIELSGWTRSGPQVKQYDMPVEHLGLRLVRAS